MSKSLPASCVAGVVTSESVPVPAAEVFSEGVGPSEGILIVDEDGAYYFAKTSPDLKSTLDQLTTALTQLVTALTSAVTALTTLDNKPLGTLPPVPAVTADTALITAAVAQITIANVQLTTLKAMLR